MAGMSWSEVNVLDGTGLEELAGQPFDVDGFRVTGLSPGLRPPSPRLDAGSESNSLLPACGEKVPEGRMRGVKRPKWFGIRNIDAKYAQRIYGLFRRMLVAPPVGADDYTIDADYAYIVLNGRRGDGTLYGDRVDGLMPALRMENFGERVPRVVFLAASYSAHSPLARQCVERGAAVIACTAAHAESSAPIHAAFWDHVKRGVPPARALVLAAQAMPMPDHPLLRARALKAVASFVCEEKES
jgi:hypothetical protein